MTIGELFQEIFEHYPLTSIIIQNLNITTSIE